MPSSLAAIGSFSLVDNLLYVLREKLPMAPALTVTPNAASDPDKTKSSVIGSSHILFNIKSARNKKGVKGNIGLKSRS